MCSKLPHNKSSGKGFLPENIPELIFLFNPEHRVKHMVTPVIISANSTKSASQVGKSEAMQYKTYLGCCVNKYYELPLEEFRKKMRKPVEHMFENHE